MTVTEEILPDDEAEDTRLPPREPSLPAGEWLRKNLFSSFGSGVLTVLLTLAFILTFRGLLGFAFSDERQWDATATNMRLMLAGPYPQEQFSRVWVSLGLIAALSGLSLGVWRAGGLTYVASLTTKVMGLGGVLVLTGLLAPISGATRVDVLQIGGLILALAFGVRHEAEEDATVPSLGVALVGALLAVGSLWVVPFGHHALVDGEFIAEQGTVQASTKVPATVMILVVVVTYFIGRAIADRIAGNAPRTVLSLSWLASPMVVVFFIMRDPDFDYGHVFSTELPIFLAYALGGGLLLTVLANPRVGELGRVVSAVGLLAAAATFLTPMLQVIRILALLLAMFALAAPTFSGDRATRIRYSTIWATTVFFLLWLITAINSPSTLNATGDYTGGLVLTLVVATFTMILSFPIGVLLALARTSSMPLFRMMSTVYIEMIRGVPLITILIFFSVLFPLFLPDGMAVEELAIVIIGFTMFSAAYLAENVRGGLQSVNRGQYEAAEALGMTTSQKTVFIVLPQALRVSIPPLVGQTIATFKETSLLAIIGLFDLLYVGRVLVAGQTEFLGSTREQLLFVSVVYWIGSYAMSRASRKLERKLGLGER